MQSNTFSHFPPLQMILEQIIPTNILIMWIIPLSVSYANWDAVVIIN